MRAFALSLLAACTAPTTAHVRDIHGRPLPTSARLDADSAPAEVRCDGRRYLVVESPPPYVAGTRVGTARVWITDPHEICARIRAN